LARLRVAGVDAPAAMPCLQRTALQVAMDQTSERGYPARVERYGIPE